MARKPIVVGVDGSVESRRAIELARRIAEAARAELVPVHAVPDLWLTAAWRRGGTALTAPQWSPSRLMVGESEEGWLL